MDRLEEIKKVAGTAQRVDDFSIEQVRWLIDEVERLRRIEDPAIAWSESWTGRKNLDRNEKPLSEAISKNPRPEATDS